MKSSARARRRRAGFSLIELMVVIAIMGLLATVVAVKVGGALHDARYTKVAADMESMKKGMEMYKISTGKYPARFEDLWTRPGNAPKWQGPYLDDVPPTPKDPWGHEYTYTPPVGSSEFLITSQGEGDEGATAITNKNLRQVLDSKGI